MGVSESTTMLKAKSLPDGRDGWVVVFLDDRAVLRLRRRVRHTPSKLGIRKPRVSSVSFIESRDGAPATAVIRYAGGEVECPVSIVVRDWLSKHAPAVS